jgi:DNA-binding transcriptional ArsR family regulator
MARTRSETYPDDLVALAAVARALAHPGRLQLLEAIAARRSCVCGELVEMMPLAQSTVSQHLKELKEAGLVRGIVDGPRTCYCVDAGKLAAVGAAFAGLFARLGCCEGPKEEDHG